MSQLEPESLKRMQPSPNRRPWVTAAGLGGALVFVLAITAFRVGKKQLVERLSHSPQESLEGDKTDRESETAKQLFTDWVRRERALEEILVLQKRHGLSDEVLNQLLMHHWQSKFGNSQVAPWLLEIGSTDWRARVDWDVREVEMLILNEAAVHKNDDTGDDEPQKNHGSHD